MWGNHISPRGNHRRAGKLFDKEKTAAPLLTVKGLNFHRLQSVRAGGMIADFESRARPCDGLNAFDVSNRDW